MSEDRAEYDREDEHAEQIEDDDTIVYATMTVDGSGDLDADRLDELFPNADHVEAHHRVSGDYLAETGDDPTSFVCPKCGEGTHSKRDIDGTPYYRHHDNKECARDVRDVLEQKREERRKKNRTPRWKRAVNLGIGVAVSIGATAGVMHLMPTSEMTINGEAATIPPTGPTAYVGAGLLIVLAITIVLALRYMPRPPAGGGRL
jgi:hypothetical protein